MTPPNLNPSAKSRFQIAAENIRLHRAMMELPAFERGMDAALLEYGSILSKQNTNGNEAMASGFKLQGALEYLQTLKTLAESAPVMVARKDLDNLPDAAQLKRQ